MQLKDLLKNVNVKNLNKIDLNLNIKTISNRAQKKVKDGLFFCYSSCEKKSKNYAKIAVENGVICVVTQNFIKNLNCMQIIVKNAREAMSIISKNFYEISDEIKFIGITGTNGKTTTSFLIKSFFDEAKIKCGVIGTEGCFYADKKIKKGLTTPDPIELFKIVKKMQKENVKIIIMEVSAHAIDLKKIASIVFSCKILTNITQDHLDYFKTFSKYKKTKLSFFKKSDSLIIVNKDEKKAKKILKYKNAISYSLKKGEFFASEFSSDFSSFLINHKNQPCSQITSNLFGLFNASNILSAVACAKSFNVKNNTIISALKKFMPVCGRLNVLKFDGINVVIDFAHTPDGLKNAICATKTFTNNKLILLFGCGGNRDAKKRPIMGRIAEKNADFVIVTSDNPRFENPKTIMNQIACKMKNNNHILIEKRTDAIKYAKSIAKENDTILICGKGAENFQEKNGRKYKYSDFQQIKNVFKS